MPLGAPLVPQGGAGDARVHPDSIHATVRDVLRERDHLFLLHEALVDAERATSLEARLDVIVEAIRKIGFGRVVLTLRDAELNQTTLVSVGLGADELRELRNDPASGVVWKRRLNSLENFRISQSYYLDSTDAWISREFHGGLPSRLAAGGDPAWNPRDALLVPLKGSDGRIIATLVLDDPTDRRRPSLARIRTVELFGQQVAYMIEQAELIELARRRADRLARLHEVGVILARSLDEGDIIEELARQIARVLVSDGIVIAAPDVEEDFVTTQFRAVRGRRRPRTPQPLGHGPIGEVARTGRAVRIADYDPNRIALAAADDTVGDGGPARSLLAVPIIVGAKLLGVIAVYSAQPNAYNQEDEEVLHTMAAQSATAIINARHYAKSQREQRAGEALADVARAVSESLRLGQVLPLILRHATALLKTEGACLSLKTGDTLHVVAASGCAQPLQDMTLPAEASVPGRAMSLGATIIVNDVSQEPDRCAPPAAAVAIQRTIIAPMLTRDGPIGVLSVINRDADFTDADARVLHRLAEQVAVAVVNARLFEEAANATREWSVAFDAIASGMCVLDAGGRVTRCNARALEVAGTSDPAALAGRPFLRAIFGDTADEVGALARSAIAERRVTRGTYRATERGRIYELHASPHPAGGAVVVFNDVTEHHLLAERHRRVVETANDAIVITDLNRRIAFANPAAEGLIGRGADLIGTPVSDTVAPELRDEVRDREKRAFDGEPQRYEAVVVRADGERRFVSVSTAPLREVGQVTGIVASLRDITAERRARDAMTQSEARYRNLLESASDAIYTMDARGAITTVNQSTCNISGYSREQLLGRNTLPFLDPEDVEDAKMQFRLALAGEPRRYECGLITARGERRLMSVTNTPIRQGSAVVGVLGVARDITADRARAEALARSEARYERLVESAADAIFTLDTEFTFTAVNRALEDATGRPRSWLIGAGALAVCDRRDADTLREVLVAALGGERRRTEVRYLGADGAGRPGSLIVVPILEQGVVTGILGIMRDVAEEKRLVDQILQQEKLAVIGQLVSGVAHELNNPLAGVMAFAQLLAEGPTVDEEQKRALESIHLEAKRTTKIVSNLLSFARRHQPERRVVDLTQVLRDTLELRSYSLRVQQIRVTHDLRDGLPPTWADPFQLQQVFLNLLSNAEQALEPWSGRRSIHLETRRDGDRLVARVIDSGPGMAPAVVQQIFNPFFTTKPVGKGTGLGLSISDGIVRDHGGGITVTSTPGTGAAFTVELPIVPPPMSEHDHGSGPAPDAPSATPRKRILVTDDEPTLREALQIFLRSLGHHVDTAASGLEALARLESARYDVVLLDLRMPDMSGSAVYEKLVVTDPEHASRVIFVTGDVNDAAFNLVRRSGRPHIGKPFRLDHIARLLSADTA